MLKLVCHVAEHVGERLMRLPREAAMALGGAVGDRPPRPERLWQSYAIILPISALVWVVLHSFTLVMSPSIDAWVIRSAPGPIHKGDLVSFDLVHPLAGPEPVSVTKRILCMPGEMLRQIDLTPGQTRVKRSAFLCQGRIVGVTRPFGRHGQRLPVYPWGDRPIEPGTVYLGSDHPDGFDSRYYGPVRIERLTRMARVL